MLSLVRLAFIAALWMLASVLLVVRTVLHERPEAAVLSAWALFAAIVAAVVTGWALLAACLVKERARVESIAQLAACTVLQHAQTGPQGVVK